MKKIVKILGITATVLVIGFSMPACSSDSYDPPDEPKTFISVTSIPSSYNGMVGAIILSSPGSDIAVYSTEEKISGNSSTFPLYNWGNEEPWTGSGTYNITFLIFKNTSEAAEKKYVYAGVKTGASITQTNTSITWSSFTDKTTSRSILINAYFQKKAARGVKF